MLFTSEQLSEHGRTWEAGNRLTGPAGMCPCNYQALSAAQPLLALTEPHSSTHISARNTWNLSAGITTTSSGTCKALDWTNDTPGQRSSTYMNTCNTKNLPTGITSASSGACRASDQTNDTLGQHLWWMNIWELGYWCSVPEFRLSSTQDVQFDRQITYTPPQHNKWIYENSATGVQCPSSGPLGNARLLSNNAGPASSAYKLVPKNSALPNTHFAIDTGQSCDVEDGKVVNWKPIPPLYELAAPVFS